MATIIAGKAGQKNQPNQKHKNPIVSFIDQKAWMLALLLCWVIVMMTAALLLTVRMAQLDSVKQELASPLIANEVSATTEQSQVPKTRRRPGNYRSPGE